MIYKELDLHGYSVQEAMEIFLDFYDTQLSSGKNKFKVIHGYGSKGSGGRIRSKLRSFLSNNQDKVSFELGENLSGNKGYTLIIPISKLPTPELIIADEIVEFCVTPKTKEKITGKFRKYGIDKVSNVIKLLEKNKLIKTVIKGKFKCYVVDE